ncbi:MAG TPA: UDP-3-O-(3-hydroxymyristoyl)glucosamine N-acyltransferase [Humisphaera sp.]
MTTGERVTLKDLAAEIGATVDGGADAEGRLVHACNTLEDAGDGEVSFLSNPKYLKHVERTKATAVIVGLGVAAQPGSAATLLRARNPYYAFTLALVRLHGHRRHPHPGVHPKAHVDPTATIGEGTVVYPGAFVGPGAVVGKDCILYPNVTVYDGCVLGDRVIVHAGAVIGQDGFGYATNKDPDGVTRHHKIPQIGVVVLEDDVEVGANCTIARGTLGKTVVGQGTKLDSAVVIGHGTTVGRHGLLVAQVGISGSCTIGDYATLAGQVGIAGHLRLGDGVTVAAKGGVMHDIPDHTTVIGIPALPVAQGRRIAALTIGLPTIVDRLKKVEQAVSELGDAGEAESRGEREK